MLTAHVMIVGLTTDERPKATRVHGGSRGDDLKAHRPGCNHGNSLSETRRRLNPGGGGQAGDSAEPGGVGDPTCTQGASNHPDPVAAQQRRENDSRHAEMGILRTRPECNDAIPQQSTAPESAVEIQDVIGHDAVGAYDKIALSDGTLIRTPSSRSRSTFRELDNVSQWVD